MEKLNKSLVAVQSKLKAPKNQRNNFGKYNYRSAEDILEAVKPHLASNNLSMTISDSIESLASSAFVNATVTISNGVDSISVSAQAGIDPNRKGMDIAQSFGSSSSYARKYALNGMFLIDDTKDADATNTHGQASSQSSNTATAKASPTSDVFQKCIDYLKSAKDKEAAMNLIQNKYADTFSENQMAALKKFAK